MDQLPAKYLSLGAVQQALASQLKQVIPTQDAQLAQVSKRIRQDKQPNKLETAAMEAVKAWHPDFQCDFQKVTLKIGNSIRYTPDIVCRRRSKLSVDYIAFEVKGPHAFDGSLEKLKMSAHEFPEIKFVLMWRDGRNEPWKQQIVSP